MSVLVRGMEMPESCPCKLVGVGYDLYCSFTSGIPSRMREYRECCEKKTRPNWCPIVEVPPHGRLIEAEPLIDYCKRFIEAYDYSKLFQDHARRHELLNMVGEIASAPTIIEAEE